MLLAPIAESSQFHQLRHQVVRDLAWCCLSPPLLQALPGSEAQILPLQDADIWPWLQALDQAPCRLIEALAQVKSTRLGIYYESLWRFYFANSPQWHLLAHNLPVNRGKTTLGAFDFLCRRGDDYWHIETAVKFYLCDTRDQQQALNWQHWIGPNSHDRFDLKLTRLRDHQLPLHYTPEGYKALQERFPDVQHWNSGLCLQGYLFSPAPEDFNLATLQAENLSRAIFRPNNSHEYQGAGFWWHLNDFLALIATGELIAEDFTWIILQREQWFSPVLSSGADTKLKESSLSDQLIHQLQQVKRPLMIAAVKKYASSEDSDLWREQLRGFVVPNNWPNQENT